MIWHPWTIFDVLGFLFTGLAVLSLALWAFVRFIARLDTPENDTALACELLLLAVGAFTVATVMSNVPHGSLAYWGAYALGVVGSWVYGFRTMRDRFKRAKDRHND